LHILGDESVTLTPLMTKINSIIIDDNELDRIAIESYLEKYSFIKLLGSFANPIECLELIQKTDIQLIFLDIDMPYLNGLEFLNSLKDPPLCIFITSYGEYALESYENHAFDFLLKPAKADRLERAVLRAREYLDIQNKAKLYDVQFAGDYLTIKESYNLIQLKVSDIIYLEALKDYTKVITRAKTYLTLCSLKNFFEKLPGDRFLRIHRSFAVAINQIRKMEQNELLLDNLRLPVGKTFRSEINRALLNNIQ